MNGKYWKCRKILVTSGKCWKYRKIMVINGKYWKGWKNLEAGGLVNSGNDSKNWSYW